MNLPIETKPALWGAVAGAALLAIAGFSWLGWTTASKAEAMATSRADAAVVAALTPVCVDRFERAGDAKAQRAALKLVDSWSQGDFVEKGGWAAAGKDAPTDRVSAVAKACAALLSQG
jgi:hypothetical protein